LLQAGIERDAQTIVADQDSDTHHVFIICVWQNGADALLWQYKQFENGLPRSDKLETMVVTKEELMRKFSATVQDFEPTTNQINTVCHNINSILIGHQVHLYIDELWVTVPKTYSAHLTQVSILNEYLIR
jgi:hypothetical protein